MIFGILYMDCTYSAYSVYIVYYHGNQVGAKTLVF
jgi:hypothetical protein